MENLRKCDVGGPGRECGAERRIDPCIPKRKGRIARLFEKTDKFKIADRAKQKYKRDSERQPPIRELRHDVAKPTDRAEHYRRCHSERDGDADRRSAGRRECRFSIDAGYALALSHTPAGRPIYVHERDQGQNSRQYDTDVMFRKLSPFAQHEGEL